MRIGFKFQLQGCQNVSVVDLIRVSKFNLKNASRSDNINNKKKLKFHKAE